MRSDEIRETFLRFFEARDHLRRPSGSLVPPPNDTSVLLTTAGMQPLKPYFAGAEKPPHPRATSCQKCFRTVDIEVVGTTTRHLTCFEMLGNFSFGDYFKAGAVEFAWDLSLNGLGFEPESIWVTVHEGDDALGLGPDEEAIGVPPERIVLLPSSENFWQAGPTGPCGPCSELYLDRGLDWGTEEDRPGGDNERFLEFWNLVFMQYDQDERHRLTPLPAQNIDTGLGLERQALIQQGVDSVFDTDLFVPLMDLGRELATEAAPDERALRILADHARGMSFLIADGVVPSNEERGYVLRKLMRRAIHQGRRIGVEGAFLTRYADVVRDLMGAQYGELLEQREAIDMWLAREEEAFGRTIEQGQRLLEEMITRARDDGQEGIGADNAFLLHDTYGFPYDLTAEIAAEHGLGTDAQGFEALMDQQRTRAREGAGRGERDGVREQVAAFAEAAAPTEFTGYGTLEQATEVTAVQNGYAKLAESPFYAEGGGQVSDSGVLEADGTTVAVRGVVRLGDDQALLIDGPLPAGARVTARVGPERRPTECNHTATHLLHAALRETLGGHVRQAGSYVGPDKLRFDFTHGAPLTPEELLAVEDRVNEEILANHPVRAITTTLEEARALGAMALFGEKYGDVVRMVSVGDGSWSRELCGGTHVRSTAEIGVCKITTETSSAANVRRIEAVTGPAAVHLLLRHDRLLSDTAAALRTAPDRAAAAAAALVTERKAARKQRAAAPEMGTDGAYEVDGVRVLVQTTDADPKALPDLADRLRGQLGETAVVVLGVPGEGKVSLVASATPAAVARGIKAGDLVKTAAQVVGGGGGGRDTMAQAGGRDPAKLPEALDAARAAIEAALTPA
ncbi:MAG: alanyl-tRNA synthetase [Solirubrobacteraceae bacterium]|nr:alanyl-tRNA synthetase [Solirubrobacteraceae bacterium]